MILDLTNLNKEQQHELDKIYNKHKSSIEKVLFNCIKKEKNFFLIFSCLVSRNPEENNLYYKISIIKLIEFYTKKKILKKIILKDRILKQYILKKFNNIQVIIKNEKESIFKKSLINFIKNLFFLTKLYIFKSNKRKENFLTKKNIILFDTFLINSMYEGNIFVDRYYSFYLNNLNREQRQRLFFLPILFNNSLTHKNIRLFSRRNNFILHTDFINFIDYVKILIIFFKLYFYKIEDLFYKGLNLKDLIDYEIKEKSLNHSFLISILTFYTFKNLKKSNASIATCVDWFENQIVDKSLNYSLKKFFPKTKSKSYMGINSNLTINDFLVPSKIEKKNNLIANEIFLINFDNKKYFKKIFPHNKIKTAPAFRNQNIYNYSKNKLGNRKDLNILVVFTGSHLDNLKMIKTLNSLSKTLCKKFNFILRFHKNSEINKIISFIEKKIKFKISKNQTIYQLLQNSKCVICRPGTISLEAEIFNVPTILTRRIYGILPIKMSSTLKKDFCYENVEIEKKLKKILKSREIKKIFKTKLANKYFAKYNLRETLNLIN